MAILVLLAALAFASAPFFVTSFAGFRPDQFPVPQIDPPVQPAGYAFAIWGVIYLWLIVSAGFGVWARGSMPDWEPMRPALALSVGVGVAWLPVAVLSPIAATVLIWLMLVTALRALEKAPALDHWLARAPVGLYAGWLTAAASVSVGLLLAGYGITDEIPAAVIGLLLALVIALRTLRRVPGSGVYGLGVTWALVGVVVADISGAFGIAVLAGIAAIVTLVMSLPRLKATGR